MHEIVFIGWNGNQKLAELVKDLLDTHGYVGVIGGDHESNPPELRQVRDTINATVRHQMDSCNQAIMILTEHGKTDKGKTAISANLCYEMGYLTAKYRTTADSFKLHIFNIGVAIDDIPSDIQGIWNGGANISQNESMEEKAKKIFDEFLRRQLLKNQEDYLKLCNDYYLIEYRMAHHFTSPMVSDHDMIFQLIFYVQSAYIYNDTNNAISKIEEFENKMRESYNLSDRFEYVFDYARLSLGVFLAAAPKDATATNVMLEDKFFRKTKREYLRIVESLASVIGLEQKWDITLTEDVLMSYEFESLLIAQIQQHLTYLFLLYLDNPNIDSDKKNEILDSAIQICNTAIDNLNLLKNKPHIRLYSQLLLGFSYHNLSVFYNISCAKDNAKAAALNALNERKSIYKSVYNRSGINQTLKNYTELEYYFELLDIIPEINDKDDQFDYCDEIDEYISRTVHRRNMDYLVFDRLVQKFQEIDSRDG